MGSSASFFPSHFFVVSAVFYPNEVVCFAVLELLLLESKDLVKASKREVILMGGVHFCGGGSSAEVQIFMP